MWENSLIFLALISSQHFDDKYLIHTNSIWRVGHIKNKAIMSEYINQQTDYEVELEINFVLWSKVGRQPTNNPHLNE